MINFNPFDSSSNNHKMKQLPSDDSNLVNEGNGKCNEKTISLVVDIDIEEPNVNNLAYDCYKEFQYKSKYDCDERIHVNVNSPDKTALLCNYCGEGFKRKDVLTQHLGSHKGKLCCTICNKIYKNRASLKKHELAHVKEKGFRCRHCRQMFDSKEKRNEHRSTEHGKSWSCPDCRHRFSTEISCDTHRRLHCHKVAELFVCESCGKQFKLKGNLKVHVESKCGTERIYKCNVCHKNFMTRPSLATHGLLHTGEKNYICKHCGKGFRLKYEMQRHELSHTGDRPFVCKVCLKGFAHRESLITHSTIHTGIRPYICDGCGRGFSCIGNLIKHRRNHVKCMTSDANSNKPRIAKPRIKSLLINATNIGSQDNHSIIGSSETLLMTQICESNKSPIHLSNFHSSKITKPYPELKPIKYPLKTTAKLSNTQDKLLEEKVNESDDLREWSNEQTEGDLNNSNDAGNSKDCWNLDSSHPKLDESQVVTHPNTLHLQTNVLNATCTGTSHSHHQCSAKSPTVATDYVKGESDEDLSLPRENTSIAKPRSPESINIHVSDTTNLLIVESSSVDSSADLSDKCTDKCINVKFDHLSESTCSEGERNQVLHTQHSISINNHVDKLDNVANEQDLGKSYTDRCARNAKGHETRQSNATTHNKVNSLSAIHKPLEVAEYSNLVCQFCGKCFHAKERLQSHLKTHDDRFDKVKKNELEYVSDDDEPLTIRLQRYRCMLKASQEIPCQYCHEHFKKGNDYTCHKKKCHRGDKKSTFLCTFCPKVFKFKRALLKHEVRHTGGIFECKKCKETFKVYNEFHSHREKVHWKKHKCKECGICFQSSSQLDSHVHHNHRSDAKPVKCDACGKTFKHVVNLRKHVESKCGTTPHFVCKTCGKSYLSQGGFQAHQSTHSRSNAFLCKFCGKNFVYKSVLLRHELSHTGEKPFVCSVCSKAFAHRVSLTTHSTIHSGIKPYVCEGCGSGFSCFGNLKKHRMAHMNTCSRTKIRKIK